MTTREVIEHREWLHRNAELSFQEFKTQGYILDTLSGAGIECREVAGTGVLAVVGDASLPAIVLRADIDALPIVEATGLSFSSQSEGVMHACGHDMHSASLIGALVELAKNPPRDRVVVGLFQPAEELAPGGAKRVIEEGVLEDFDVVAMVAWHVSPELNVGVYGLCAGPFMASADEVHIEIVGRGGHAARPREHLNPVWAAAELLEGLRKIAAATSSDNLLSIGRVEALGATNIVPSSVTIAGTLRSYSQRWRVDCMSSIEELCSRVGGDHGLEIVVNFGEGYPPLVNDVELTACAGEILRGVGQVVEVDRRMTSEDFARYGKYYPLLFCRLGVCEADSGGCGELHRADFNPSEQALRYGVLYFVELAQKVRMKNI